MSANNGVIRIARKGTVKFAFGDGAVFEVDVVSAFQRWIGIDEGFRLADGVPDAGTVPQERMLDYYDAATAFATWCASGSQGEGLPESHVVTPAEALDFIARLRECYDDVAAFFRPRSREERGSPGTSEAGSGSTSKTELRFSREAP